jgi:hypothetical protein
MAKLRELTIDSDRRMEKMGKDATKAPSNFQPRGNFIDPQSSYPNRKTLPMAKSGCSLLKSEKGKRKNVV